MNHSIQKQNCHLGALRNIKRYAVYYKDNCTENILSLRMDSWIATLGRQQGFTVKQS